MKKSCELPFYCQILKDLRKENGYTQNYVATQISVEVKTYRSWEIGYYKDNVQMFPKIDNDKLEALADLYNVSVDYILGRSNCTSVENQKIKEITGLSNDAIETLKSLKNVYEFDKDMKIFNYIMSDRQLFSLFLSDLRNYIESGYNVPIHPVQDEKTKNIKYVENIDIESDSILVNTERRVYVGKENGEFNGEPLYDIMGIPISSLASLSMLQIQEILLAWKENYKRGDD